MWTKIKQNKVTAVGAVLVVFVITVVGVHLQFGSHASVPPTANLANVCGVVKSSDIEQPATYPNSPAKAITPVLADDNMTAGNGNTAIWQEVTINGTPEAYVLYGGTSNFKVAVYNLSTGAQIGTSFPVANWGNADGGFTVDPSGNVYVTNTNASVGPVALYKYSPSGAQLFQVSLQSGARGAAYGYTDNTGTWYVATVVSLSGTADYNYTGTSAIYNTSGTLVGTNNMVEFDTVSQQANNDILGFQDSSVMRVYSQPVWNAANKTDTATLKLVVGAGRNSNVWGINNPQGGFEDGSGNYYVADRNHGIDELNSSGAYLGVAPDQGLDDASYNSIGDAVGSVVYSPTTGKVTYIAAGGLNPGGNQVANPGQPGLYSVSLNDLDSYIAFPPGINGHLGIGASLSDVPVTGGSSPAQNYYANGTTPKAYLNFYPGWAAQSANYTVKYSVQSVEQIEAQQAPTLTSVPLSNIIPAGATSPASMSVSGLPTTPGAYEVSARIYNNSNPNTAVGADCLDYTVGSANANYSPAAIQTAGTSGDNTAAVEIAHELGNNYVRADYAGGSLMDACFPGGTTTLSCPADLNTDVAAASALAKKYGITFVIMLGSNGNTEDTTFVNDNQWSNIVTQMAQHFSAAPYNVTNWQDWNEINNGGAGLNTPSNAVKEVMAPTYSAIKAVNSNAVVIGGSTVGPSPGFWQGVGAAGGFKDMDAIDMHPYTDYDKGFEEQGFIIPPLNAAPGETASLGTIDQLKKIVSDTKDYAFNTGVTSLPIYDSEFGVQQGGQSQGDPDQYYTQGDRIVRDTILQNSIGISNIAIFAPNVCAYVSPGYFGTISCGHDGGNAPGQAAEQTMQSMLYGPTVAGNRKFIQWLPTGVPHTYAAEYGPSSSDTTHDVVAVWADEFTTPITPTLPGGGSIPITDEYGSVSSVASGGSIALTGSVQYLTVPTVSTGQPLTLNPPETFTSNQALASVGATATASSTSSGCSSAMSPSLVINGVDDLSNDDRCNSAAHWAQSPTDTNPSLTVTLKSAESIDRVFVSSSDIQSAVDGLRSFDVQVASTNGGAFTTVGTVTNAFFQRNHMVSFPAQTVAQIRIANLVPNFSGSGDGLPPSWWPVNAAQPQNKNYNPWTDPSQPWYGQDTIMDVEAYTPGSGVVTTPPPTTPTNLAASSVTNNQVSLTWSPSTDTGASVAGYDILRRTGTTGQATQIGTSTSASYTDTTVNAGTAYSYSVEAYNNANPPGLSSASAELNVTTSANPDTTAPSVPTGLTTAVTTTGSTNQVKLSWTASTDNAGGSGLAGYNVYRNGVEIGDTGATTTSFVDSSVVAGTTYSYTVQAADNASNLSAQSTAANATIPQPADTTAPSVPANVTATASSPTQVAVSWSASTDNAGGSGLAGYYVIRNGVTISALLTATSYTDSSVTANTKYSYTIEAADKAGNVSAPSNAATVTTPNPVDTTPPSAPTSLVATAVNSSQINLTWAASTDNVGVKNYQVFRSTGSGSASQIATVTTTTYGDTGLVASTTYSYYVVAVDGAGNKSASSSKVTATTSQATSLVTIYGTVSDASSKKALAGVSVRTGNAGTANGAAQSTTNSAGQYLMTNITPTHTHNYYYNLAHYQSFHFNQKYAVGKYEVDVAMTVKHKQ
jgi:fibronectin type 3 domain-containing protein